MRASQPLIPMLVAVLVAGCGGASEDPAPPPAPVKRIFVTSAKYNGNLKAAGGGTTGMQGADNLCSNAALAANLGGTWKAWLSDSTTNAIARIADVGPWYFVDGTTKVFNNKAHLTSTPLVPINRSEFNQYVWDGYNGSTQVGWAWTGTALGGTVRRSDTQIPYTCEDWTVESLPDEATYGDTYLGTNLWTDGGRYACSILAHLYCIEQ